MSAAGVESAAVGGGRRPARLILSDGTVYSGFSFGAATSVAGEAVFQTGMVGYTESLTDPSYTGQLLCLTYPMIGNYGIPDESAVDEHGLPCDFESDKIHPAALIVADLCDAYSHWKAKMSLSDYLAKHKVPGICDIDTRALTKQLRVTGSMQAKIVLDGDDEAKVPFYDPNLTNLVAKVSVDKPREFNPSGKVKIVAVDVGLKYNQLRCLISRGASVKLVPWNYDFSAEKCDGVFISNGPGDPAMATETITCVKKLFATRPQLPVFGICLGHQLMSIAAGATTYKLPFGNRGHNQPCTHMDTQKCFITSQNHGFATDVASLPEGWIPLFTNENDQSNEGIVHAANPWFSVQFHPEANGGPQDLEILFDVFLARCRGDSTIAATVREDIKNTLVRLERPCLPPGTEPLQPRKVLILGSGGLTIGQAGEFDYSGSQAIKAMKEEGVQTVLINPNIATVQTMRGLADKVYFVPVTPEFVEETIAVERPDSCLLSFGGQTALNCGIQLEKRGVFAKYNVKVLGTPVQAIEDTEDREIFAGKVAQIGESTVPSMACATLAEVMAAAEKVGFPIMMRSSFALGGLGSGVVDNAQTLKEMATIAFSSTTQITIEPSLKGWKELEYEVVRDCFDNCITVCNMENFDPLGVHTGESIVVAPSQTLTDEEYNMLRTCAIKVVKHIGIVGECNIQYAVNPHSKQYYIIEVNARLSRSSALASKATGYPLAYVAAKLALNQPLPQLRNSVTKKTTACFEPSLDYCVVKVPRWDLNKFPGVNRRLGTAMKSVGEVMAIGRTFEEAFQKSIRMLDVGADGFEPHKYPATDAELENPTDVRYLCLATAFAEGYTVDRLYELTKIDRWFLYRLEGIAKYASVLSKHDAKTLDCSTLTVAKKLGYSDRKIAGLIGSNEVQVRKIRSKFNLRPRVKQIDTVAAEYPAQTNYLYLTYHGTTDDVEFTNDHTMVLGSGVYRIGSSVEFDYCAVGCVRELGRLGHKTIMLNYNPETVSTDYDECSRLYFDQLTFETTMDVYELENPVGVILAMGGQIPNNMAMDLFRQRVRILGTSPEMIDGAENRFKFSRMCDTNGIDQPKWKELTSVEEAHAFCHEVTYPCLMRPSYILSGVGMRVVYSKTDLEANFKEASVVSRDFPVVISKFITGAKEVEVDAVARQGEIIVFAISEHVENAGIHSGDATIIHPPQDLTKKTLIGVEKIARQVARALKINGPFNIQFIAKDDKLKVIECNVRVSRSFPFVSKTIGIDFIKIATQVMIGMNPEVPSTRNKLVGVKVPQFSFSRLAGADPTVGVDMISTGEVACFGLTKEEAYLKALVATSFKLPKANVLLSIGSYADKAEFAESARFLHEMGFTLWGSVGTADYYSSEHGIPITDLTWMQEDEVVIAQEFAEGNFDLVVNVSLQSKRKVRRPAMGAAEVDSAKAASFGFQSRRGAVDHKVPLITDIKCAKLFVRALKDYGHKVVVGPVDCKTARDFETLPSLVATNVAMGDVEATSRLALSGGFTVALAIHPLTESIVDAFSKSVVDVGVIAASTSGSVDPKSNVSSPSRRARSRSTSAESPRLLGPEEAPLPTAYSVSLPEEGSADSAGILLKYSLALAPDALMVVDAGACHLNAVLLFSVLHERAVHLINVRNTTAVRLIRLAKSKNFKVTCSVSLSTLFAADSDESQESFWGLAKDIDIVTISHDAELDGVSELELALPLLFGAVRAGKITQADVIRWLSINPSTIFNIELDSESNFTEVDTMVDHATLNTPLQRACNAASAFRDAKLSGRVTRTVLHGEPLFVDGAVFATAGVGELVSPILSDVVVSSTPRPDIMSPKQKRAGVSGESTPEDSDDELQMSSASELTMMRMAEDALVKAHVLNVRQFTREILHVLYNVAHKFKIEPNPNLLKGKVLASIFYEASTRTSCSFSSAMQRLGGSVIPLHQIGATSVSKGESLHDFVRTMECYADVIVLRHPEKGSVAEAASYSVETPILNAGDGTGEHPTQALLDVFTIREELGTVNNLKITMLGDLKHGRTVHSLARLLAQYKVTLSYVSPESLRMPKEIVDDLAATGVKQTEHTDINDVIGETDVLYVTRLQRERFNSPDEAAAVEKYVVNTALMAKAKDNMIVMHPLPRVDEISSDVDSDPRAAYFRQMQNGVYVRMALLSLVLGMS